jgi:hypothetical protein
MYCDVEIPGGIPFNGKGENSWDCGTDGLFGSSFPIDVLEGSVSKCIGKVVENVMDSRFKYGTPSIKELEKWRHPEKNNSTMVESLDICECGEKKCLKRKI